MDQAIAQALADGYAAYTATGDLSVLRMFSPECYDNVSGRRGLHIFTVVSGWLEESFATREALLAEASPTLPLPPPGEEFSEGDIATDEPA